MLLYIHINGSCIRKNTEVSNDKHDWWGARPRVCSLQARLYTFMFPKTSLIGQPQMDHCTTRTHTRTRQALLTFQIKRH